MKLLILASLIIGGCSSWSQKDFKKELDKPADIAEPQVKADEKLLEKFEVQAANTPVEEAKKESPQLKEKPKKITGKKEVTKKASEVAKPVAEVKAPFPKDYPEELKVLNAKSKKVWDLYKPSHSVDEKIYLDIHYLGMTVGKIMFTNQGKKMINNREVWHLHARFKSAPFYSNIYELNDTVDTFVTTDNFLSIRYSLIQRESKQDIDDLQLHDRDQLKTFWFYKQKKSDGDAKDKNKEAFIPHYSIDPFSVLFFFQGLPLKDGDIYEIPVINKAKILNLRSVVEGREVIDTPKGRRKAIRVHATTQYTGEHLKSGNIYLWFSDDAKRTLLKAQAKIKIGSVTADIVDG